MLTTAPPAYWDKMYATRTLQYEDEATPFKELFHQYLPRGGTCFEVGCYPGQFLIYLGKHFGYSVSGMDTTPAVDEVLPAHIAAHGVQVDRLVRGDFFTTPIEERFDIV